MYHEDLIEVPYSGVVDYDVRYEKQGLWYTIRLKPSKFKPKSQKKRVPRFCAIQIGSGLFERFLSEL
jgi:hypothetical protein